MTRQQGSDVLIEESLACGQFLPGGQRGGGFRSRSRPEIPLDLGGGKIAVVDRHQVVGAQPGSASGEFIGQRQSIGSIPIGRGAPDVFFNVLLAVDVDPRQSTARARIDDMSDGGGEASITGVQRWQAVGAGLRGTQAQDVAVFFLAECEVAVGGILREGEDTGRAV